GQPLPVREESEARDQEYERIHQQFRPRSPGREEQVAERHEQCEGTDRVEQPALPAWLRRNVNETPPTQPENERGQEHQNAGNGKGDARSEMPLLFNGESPPARQQRRQVRPRVGLDSRNARNGKEGTEIDAEVEDLVDGPHAEPVALAELVPDVGRHAGLDAAGAESNQREAQVDAGKRVFPSGKDSVACTVEKRDVENRPILASESVGNDCPEQGQRVDTSEEQVNRLA